MGTHNLPQYTTPPIGREAEIADVGDRLRDPNCRLLTLVGPGGIGKTRPAIEAASMQVNVFRDGIFFVPLQPVASVDNVVRAVGRAIGYEFAGGSEPDIQLHQHLHGVGQLLILDNLEHLLAAVGMIADLLSATSQLKLLVTSRESLNLQDEWLYQVEGLPYPELNSLGAIESFGAVRLFAEHAGRVQREFSLDDEKAAVIRICQLVRGIPLGIELAAKWRRRLPPFRVRFEVRPLVWLDKEEAVADNAYNGDLVIF